MTFLGKLLAVLVLVGSVTALTWSIVFSTQKQPWMGVAKKDGSNPAPVNPIATVAESIKSADSQQESASARLIFAQADTLLGEIRKPIRRDFYQGQLDRVRRGTAENKEFPVLGLSFYPKPGEAFIFVDRDPGQAFNLGADGKQIDTPKQLALKTRLGLDLFPIEDYQRKIPLAVKLALDQDALKNAAIEAMKALTLEIGGMGETKGLRTLIVEQESIKKLVDGELDYLLTISRNRQVDRLIFSRRLVSMEAREKELRDAIGTGTTASAK